MDIYTLLFGFLFGFAMQYAKLNKFNTISGMVTLEDFTMAKTMAVAIGLGSVIMALSVDMGLAEYHVKPLIPIVNILGGIIFGIGMAILGYCPGTLPISLGQGALDALVGIAGGLTGGYIFTLLYDHISPLYGKNYGNLNLYSESQRNLVLFYMITLLFAIILISTAFWLDKKEKTKDKKWLVTGVAFALINGFMMLNDTFGRPIGASTAYPYVANVVTGNIDNAYFQKIAGSGGWQVVFLSGAFLAGLLPALIKKEFQFSFVQERWIQYHGPDKKKRLIWAFVGGFLLIFGARIAGGCASGHILSGAMQLSYGSLLFSMITFIAFFATGHYFYKKHKK